MAKQQTKTIHLTVKQALLVVVLLIVVSAVRWYLTPPAETYSMENIPPYDGTPYVVLNDNQPSFTEEDMTDVSYEFYSDLDELGRCGVTEACIGRDLMPTEKRGDISSVKPTGWVQNQYDFVDGKSLWNRCHLIGFQLAGENANECNLILSLKRNRM